jgi:NAD(P) transhydrogenase subunit alpha
MARVGVPREIAPDETRVALIPETAGKLTKAGFEIFVEAGAGKASGYEDAAYAAAGAAVLADVKDLYGRADIVVKVREPMAGPAGHEAELLRSGVTLVGFLNPARNGALIEKLATRGVTAFSMEYVPRITRAQKMDALSSMSTVAGYKAVLLAANVIGRFFPLFMTAAGTIPPARVFILGAGVAGLQAIATARRLGAVVEAFDVRPAARDEVKSLGATFVGDELVSDTTADKSGYAKEVGESLQAKIRELTHKHCKTSDVVITTANVPGKRAPVLVTAAMVKDMKPGSVIVDLAAESGGNCELSQPGKTVVEQGVTILAPLNIAGQLPYHASMMYSRNIWAVLTLLVTKEGQLKLDFEDEIIRESVVTHDGRVLKGGAAPAPAAAATGAA